MNHISLIWEYDFQNIYGMDVYYNLRYIDFELINLLEHIVTPINVGV